MDYSPGDARRPSIADALGSSLLGLGLRGCVLALGLLVGCGGTAAVEQDGAGGGAGDPVVCGEVTCSAGQLCLWPPDTCDYSTQPPQVVRDDKACANVPAACAGESGSALLSCLETTLCTGVVTSGLSTYEEGLLTCGPAWYDCF